MTTNKKENAGFYSMPAIRYAHVLSELGISGAAVEETEEILEQTKELKEILEHPVITKENKHDIIDRIFPEEMKNFLKVVVDNGKVDIVMEIFGAYEELEKKRAKIATAKLRYVTLPSEEQKKKMETFICKTFAADGVSWEMKEDPELLGGFILLVDGKEYDYSMASVGNWSLRINFQRVKSHAFPFVSWKNR